MACRPGSVYWWRRGGEQHLVSQLHRLADLEQHEDGAAADASDAGGAESEKVVRELWGPGGPLAELTTKSAMRAPRLADRLIELLTTDAPNVSNTCRHHAAKTRAKVGTKRSHAATSR